MSCPPGHGFTVPEGCHWMAYPIGLRSNHADAEIDHVGYDGGNDSADGMGEDSLGGQFAVAERVKHSGMSAEIAAPAHANGRENRYRIAVDPPWAAKLGTRLSAAPTAPRAVMGRPQDAGR